MSYTSTRYTLDQRRTVVWRNLAPFLHHRFGLGTSILDVGCGYGDFINHVPAARRTAIDQNESFSQHLSDDVRFVQGDAAAFYDAACESFPDERYSAVFSSNLLEHLSREAIESFFAQALRALEPEGKLVLLLPNYARAAERYFDDYTHLTPIAHDGLHDWLTASGFRIQYSHPGFLPFSVKGSRLPITDSLVRAWLHSPLKPGGKQMLFVAEPAHV